MAFTLPTDLPTTVVDGVSTVDAAFFNNLGAMSNAIKAATLTLAAPTNAVVATAQTTTSTTYTDLTTTTDTVTVTVGASGKVLVIIYANIAVTGGYAYVSYAISGANTVAATDTKALIFTLQYQQVPGGLSASFLETGLTAGSTTFKMKYRSDGNSQTFANRRITVLAFP